MGEGSYNNLSADDIATMRARRILLNEKLDSYINSDGKDKLTERLNYASLEAFVRGINSRVTIENSPIAPLITPSNIGDEPEDFLKQLRLVGIAFTKFSGTVESVSNFKLGLKMDSLSVDVDFSGVRPKNYANVEPSRIRVVGNVEPMMSIDNW